ncbi:MAG TPA: ribonuclease III [Chloroflexota bacterium]
MHDTTSAAETFSRTLGYSFHDPSLLLAALIHTSYVNERPGRGLESNERLEFLGDAVLGVVVAHRLYELRPESPEGELTVLRAWLVRQSTLARWAREMAIGPHLLLGRGESRAGGRDRPALLSRGFEAVIGAIYLDGGLDAARSVVLPLIDRDIQAGFSPQRVVDAKSRLQQVTQARFESTPIYNLVDHSGPGHAPLFVVEVKAGPEIFGRGSGHSKRAAQQAAAHAALQMLNVKEGYEEPQDEFPSEADDDAPASRPITARPTSG